MMAPLAQGNREVCAEFMRIRPLFDRGKEVFDKLSTLPWRKVWGYRFVRGCWLSAGYRLPATGYGPQDRAATLCVRPVVRSL